MGLNHEDTKTRSKYKAYPNYKDSGIEWLGEVPEHWAVMQIKRLSPVKRGASPRPIEDPKYFDDEGEFSWVRIADVSSSKNGLLTETTQRLSKLGASLSVKIYPNELFISIAGTVGKPCISKIKACIHDGFVYFPKINIPSEFLFKIFESGLCYQGLGKMGTQLNLNTETVGGIHLALPPKEELDYLLNFLDQETGKMDLLIEKQQTMIALLKEKRQAVISHAVTKGLNPEAPMKDSGIKWLGQIPEHWNTGKLSSLTSKIGSGKTPSGGADVYSQEGIAFLRSQNIYDTGLKLDDVVFISEKINQEMKGTQVKNNDCLLNITGGSIGRSTIYKLTMPANVNQHVAIIRSSIKLSPDFLNWYLKTNVVKALIDEVQVGGNREGLNFEQIGRFPITLPSLEEQQKISIHLDVVTQKIDTLIEKSQQAIALLKERKTTLISAAVTGKIDVREVL